MEYKVSNVATSGFPSSSSDSCSSNSVSLLKYYGLEKPNYYKKLQRDLIHLTSYILATTPSFTTVHSVMSFLRILQFVLPCFIPSYFNFWIRGSIDQITMNIISVFFLLIPPTSIFTSSYILHITYIILQFFITSLIIFLSFYYKKYAKLPKFLPTFIYLYQSTLGYYLCPIIANSIFQDFSYLATGKMQSTISNTKIIIIDVFSLIFLYFNFHLIFIDLSLNLEYRPISLASNTPVSQFIIFMMTIFINIFFGVGTNLNKKQQIILLSFNIIFYIFTAFSVFFQGGFIQTHISNFVLSSAISGTVFTLIDIIFIAINKKGSLILLFAFIIFFILMLILNFLFFQNITIKQLRLLDLIQSDNSYFSFIKSQNQFVFIASTGIKYAHPIIIDKSFFVLGSQRWEKDQFVYLIYTKFVAIYPEETSTLKFVYKNIEQNKYNGLAVHCISEQAKAILKQRETGMTAQLRNRLNQLKRQDQSTKHKLEHVWDVVILGNINEIEVATKAALVAINETDADIKRLLVEYPNNRNVTHFYSIFLNDVIGDHNMSQIYHEKTKLLLPGTINCNDQTHEYGLKMFPNLPNSIKVQKDPILSSDDNQMFAFNSFFIDREKDKEKQNNLDMIAAIKRNIEDLKIPAIVRTKIIRILTTLIVFIIPAIAAFIYLNIFMNELKKTLEFISSLSLIRTYAFHTISFSIRYIGENISIFPKIIENDNQSLPRTFGYSWNTKNQLDYIFNETTNIIRDFDKYRSFEENNYYVSQAHSLVFQNTLPYTFYASPTNITTINISLQAAIIDFTIQQKSLLTGRSLDPSILTTGIVLNLFNNAAPIMNNINIAIRHIFDFLKYNFISIKKSETLIFVVIVIVTILAYSITMVIQIKMISSNKKETYQCLFSLPKNVVSKLADYRNINKKENQAEDMNKQDDNIIRTFNSYGSYDKSFSGIVILSIGSFFIVVLAIICTILFLFLFLKLTRIIITSAPYLHYVLSSYTMLLSSVNWLNILLFEFGGHPIPTTNFNNTLSRMQMALQWSNYYYHILFTGSDYTDNVPLKEITQAINDASPKNCSLYDSLHLNQNRDLTKRNKLNTDIVTESDYNDAVTLLDCSSIDMLYVLIEPIIRYSIFPYQNNITDSLDPKMPEYTKIWRALISPLYDLFFEPLHFEIYPTISRDLKNMNYKFIVIIVVLFICIIFIEFIMYLKILFIENHIKSVLKLLLHCNPSVIFSSSKITRILAGDFSGQQNESLDHNNNFFNTIFTNLPDAIMFANSEMIIQSVNNQCYRVFGNIDLIGKSITDFFMSDKFKGNVETLFSSVESNPIEEIEYKNESNTDIFLKVTSMMANGKFVMICQDVTQAHNYNTLILTEKQNSDKLLETILPPSLVGRVQQGEKNISLSVQSASILFSDIVSFTPWCGSLPPEKVMSTLNILFKRMDKILDTKPTMTKIKCIGDCYMAAGGIFAELNQPAIHAKEVVSFGLLSIKEILSINKEIHENLRIRVGVNTGGPIVAGVLGIGKPTFEIIGPAINRAQQMEQNGVPMKVHISISVYELICGLNFKFSNRRTIDCKNEKVETYLVEP